MVPRKRGREPLCRAPPLKFNPALKFTSVRVGLTFMNFGGFLKLELHQPSVWRCRAPARSLSEEKCEGAPVIPAAGCPLGGLLAGAPKIDETSFVNYQFVPAH